MSGVYATPGPPEKNAIEMGIAEFNRNGFTVDGNKHTTKFIYAGGVLPALKQLRQAGDAGPVMPVQRPGGNFDGAGS